MQWFSGWSMALKHFLFLFAGTLLLFGALAWVNLKDSENLFRKQVLSDAEVIIDRTNLYLNAYLDNVQNVLLLLSEQSGLMAAGNEAEAERVLRQYAEKNSSLYKMIYLVRADGKVMSNKQTFYDIIGNPEIERLLAQARSTYGVFITEPYDSPMSGKTVAFVLPLQAPGGGFAGMAVAEIDLVRLSALLTTFMNTDTQTFAIVTSKGNTVQTFDTTWPLSFYRLLPYHTNVVPPQLNRAFVEQVAELPLGASDIQGPLGDLVAVKSGVNRLGWHFIAFYEGGYFYKNMISLTNNYRTAALIWIVILFISSYMMSRYFTYPVRMLVAKMDRVREIEVFPGIAVTRSDEIGKLASSYNAMMERIQHLVSEIKEAESRKQQFELKMLQSQIAPHFLYNTLACISSLAKQQKTDAVRETIRSLVGLLSFSFDKKSEFVTLEEELEGLRMYAQIQQVRYRDKFALRIEAEPEALPCAMLKLTLQPLVENAIFHGLAPLKAQGDITVRAKCRRGRLIVTVRDDGTGMDSEQLASIFAQRRQAPSKHRFTGIGVMNVQERIRLHFGAEYGLRVFSRPGSGTLVRIELPVQL